MCKVLEGYTVYLTGNIKPQREQMADIVKCSGGEPLDYTRSVAPGHKVVVVTCEEDLSLTSDACVAGVPVCSTELVLGGVLRQHVDIDSYPINYCVLVYTALYSSVTKSSYNYSWCNASFLRFFLDSPPL